MKNHPIKSTRAWFGVWDGMVFTCSLATLAALLVMLGFVVEGDAPTSLPVVALATTMLGTPIARFILALQGLPMPKGAWMCWPALLPVSTAIVLWHRLSNLDTGLPSPEALADRLLMAGKGPEKEAGQLSYTEERR